MLFLAQMDNLLCLTYRIKVYHFTVPLSVVWVCLRVCNPWHFFSVCLSVCVLQQKGRWWWTVRWSQTPAQRESPQQKTTLKKPIPPRRGRGSPTAQVRDKMLQLDCTQTHFSLHERIPCYLISSKVLCLIVVLTWQIEKGIVGGTELLLFCLFIIIVN